MATPAPELAMLPRAALQQALRKTTRRIARELDTPLPQAPDWDAQHWPVAMAVAVMHGVSGLLAGRLRWRGPACWDEFLAGQREQGRLRQQRVRQLLDRIDPAARQARVPVLALKGSALLGLALYAPGERPMSDIDLLCPDPHFDPAVPVLQGLGYADGVASWRHREFVPADTPDHRAFGEHVDNPVKIELHGQIVERLPLDPIDITHQLFPREAHDGVNAYPSLAALMRHLLFHAAGNQCSHFIRLIHLHDIAVLAPRLDRTDWDELLHPDDTPQPAWWLLPPLLLVARHFPGRLPAWLLAAAAPACPPWLRRATARCELSEVSMSSLHIAWLPGLTWSRTPAEALRWAAARLHPGHDGVALAQAARSHHALSSTGWARQPRWQRGLRILLGQAPRATTIYSVRRAQQACADATSAACSASIRAAV